MTLGDFAAIFKGMGGSEQLPTLLPVPGEPLKPLEVLGGGATSRVLLAERGGDKVVVKLGKDPSQRRRFAEEAERLCLVDSPWVATLLDVATLGGDVTVLGERFERGAPLLVFEWEEGEALSSLAGRTHGAARRELLLLVARDVGAALSDLHGVGSAHGDIKPQNIVLTKAGARLIDFGLAGDASAESAAGGTRRYLAPEVSTGGGGDARRRDSYALGVVLSELLDTDDPLRDVARALTQDAPGARPSPAWVERRALGAGAPAVAGTGERGERAVRRAYRFAQRRELWEAARAGEAELAVGPRAREVLAPVLELLRKVRALRGQAGEGAARVTELDALGRARFLVALVGVAASSWPELGLGTDDELLQRAARALLDRPPHALSFLDFEPDGNGRARVVDEPLALALALREQAVSDVTVDAAEEAVRGGAAPEALLLELTRVLRLRGELGRAVSLLETATSAEARVELSESWRRAGDLPRALALLESLSGASPAVEARAAALRARAELDAGRLEEAARWLSGRAATPQIEEVSALLALRQGRPLDARRHAERARLLSATDEQRARAESLFGMLAHSAGQPEAALVAFRASREFAARAGAVVEEATYATGVAAAAASVGDLGEALDAGRRALLLFEHLGRGAEAARAMLSVAAAYAAAGATLEAREAAEDAVARARASADRRCRAYAHFVLCDVSASDADALEHVERARTLLEPDNDDALRCAARQLQHGAAPPLVPNDTVARSSDVAIDARLEWWGARARGLTERPGSERGDEVLAELTRLSRSTSPVSVRGPALLAGARLAAKLGDGATARHLTEAVADAGRELLRRAPDELKPAVLALPWLSRGVEGEATAAPGFTPEQISDVEALVRALGHRERLRPLLDQVLDALVLWTGVERGLLLLRAPNGRLRPRAARNIGKHDLSGVQLQLSTSLAERALAEGRPVVAVDAAGDLPEVHESVHALKLRSVLAVPLVARGEPLGVVYLDDRARRGAFGARELSWVRLVATLAALAIADARDQLLLRRAARRAERASARLHEELSRREAELDVAERELSRVKSARETRFSYDAIIGKSEAVRSMLQIVDRVTATDVPVLLLGESGSGKELVARAIHQNGARAKASFVSENCAAIPEPLLESTLFGHVRGAFTGAQRARAGLFEVADRGTLFLDEVGEMSPGMQTKLLRALQSGEVRPVGAETVRYVDVRVIAATHRDLSALVAAGKFREDLLYRLNVISVRVPPLRERFGDVALLVQHFAKVHAVGGKPVFERAALEALAAYAWPGNVRQLENEVRRALVLTDDVVRVEHLSPEIARAVRPARAAEEFDLRGRVDALEADLVRAALRRTDGNQTRAAELLGLSRFGLQKMMKRLEIRQERSDA